MPTVVTTRSVVSVLGVESDSFSVDWRFPQEADQSTSAVVPRVHTVILFVPGNPGLVDWYTYFFDRLVGHLGPGFAARGVANAGHSLNEALIRCHEEERNRAIAWTVDGQVRHKVAYIDRVLQDIEPNADTGSNLSVRLIFISHSIGVHFTTRLLVLRPDLLRRTRLLLNLMPFVRMGAPFPLQSFFDLGAQRPAFTIAVTSVLMRALRALPESVVHLGMKPKLLDAVSRDIGVSLLRQPEYAANFFALGSEEIRDVPEVFDTGGLRTIGKHAPTVFLFAGRDHWSPECHLEDLERLQKRGALPPPEMLSWRYDPRFKHAFVGDPTQVDLAVHWCLGEIRRVVDRHRSKL